MPLDPVKVGLAVADGVSTVCSTCTKYWRGRDLGLPDGKCTTQSRCGSPLAGGDFHDYEGPIADFSVWCFVCGQSATHGVRLVGKKRQFGMCDEHVKWLAQMEAVNGPEGNLGVLVNGVSGVIRPEQLLKKRAKQTLGELIYEVESYYAKKEGREFTP